MINLINWKLLLWLHSNSHRTIFKMGFITWNIFLKSIKTFTLTKNRCCSKISSWPFWSSLSTEVHLTICTNHSANSWKMLRIHQTHMYAIAEFIYPHSNEKNFPFISGNITASRQTNWISPAMKRNYTINWVKLD